MSALSHGEQVHAELHGPTLGRCYEHSSPAPDKFSDTRSISFVCDTDFVSFQATLQGITTVIRIHITSLRKDIGQR